MAKSNLLLEMELGVTGGEEDGVDNSGVDSALLYTQPSEVYEVYKSLSTVPNGMFTVAAAFGNVHGVYAPGNVKVSIAAATRTHARACVCLRPRGRRRDGSREGVSDASPSPRAHPTSARPPLYAHRVPLSARPLPATRACGMAQPRP
jgi:hypothetical protein